MSVSATTLWGRGPELSAACFLGQAFPPGMTVGKRNLTAQYLRLTYCMGICTFKTIFESPLSRLPESTAVVA
jgi:hypothetical protein